jgi:hypothetical protein
MVAALSSRLRGWVQVAKQETSTFLTPRGCSIPFGSMEAAIRASKKEKEFYRLMSAVEDADTEALAPLCAQLQELVADVRPPHKMLQEVRPDTPLHHYLHTRSSRSSSSKHG